MLAKKYPEKIESMIINSYKSHIPGELSKKWSKKARKGVSQGMRNISVVTLGMVLLRYIGSLPWTVQRVAIHSLQPLVVAAGIIFVLFIVDNPIVAVIFAIPFVAKIIHFTIVKCTNRDGWCADRWNRKGRADRRIISNVSPVQTPTFGDIKNIAIIPKDDIAPSVHTTLRSNDRHRIIQNDSNDCRSDQSSELSDSTEGDILVKVPNIHAPEKALRDVIQGSARIDPIENIQNSYLSGHINSEHLPNYNVNQNQKKETKRHKSTVANSLANQLGEDASVERPLPVQSISEAGAKALAAAVHLSDQLRQLQVGSSDDNDSSSS